MTVRANESIKERSCGLCGSPNCLSHALEGGGTCPFDDCGEGWGQEERSGAVESILNANRTSPSIHEITPCSEYSRYTIEGILADPLCPDKNAVFEVRSLGALFRSSRFREKKWSDPLSYGMALDAEDIRIHLQGKGKVIIRRAHDVEEASRLYMEVADLMLPSLYCSIGGHTMADTVKEMAVCRVDPPACLGPMTEWPPGSARKVDMGLVVSSCRAEYETKGSQLRIELGSVIQRGASRSDADRIFLSISGEWAGSEKAGYGSREEALGARTYYLMADLAADSIVRFAVTVAEGEGEKERLLKASEALFTEGIAGRSCSIDLTEESPEDRAALRNIWRAVRALGH